VKSYCATGATPQPYFAGRFIFLLAGLLRASTSIVIAGLNGFNRGATLPEAVIWCGAGVGLALISLAGISGALTNTGSRRILAAVAYVFGLSFTVVAALGSQHGGRSSNEATAMALTSERSRLEVAYKRADAALGRLPETRPVAVIQSELDAILKDMRLNDCQGWLENSRLRATCVERVEPRRKELANAQERKRLTDELASTSRALSSLTLPRPANADADSLGRYLEALGVNIPRDQLADSLNLLTVASVELAGGIALALGNRPTNNPAKHPTGKWLNIRPKGRVISHRTIQRNQSAECPPDYQQKSQQRSQTQNDRPNIKSPDRPEQIRPDNSTNPASKEDALASLLTDLALGRTFGSQEELAARFGRPRSTVSDWVREWQKSGLIPKRRKRGRNKATCP
jgi:hypothetical protein